jgi:curved DNA-binding protein CbpA
VRRATALDPAALRATLASLQGADHFQVLGVKRDAPAAQVKAAYFQLAKLYHPDAIPSDAPPDVRKLCADLFGRVSAAWADLGDEARRAQYVQELQSGGAPEVDVMGILQAENLFQAGTQLVKARRYDEAHARFQEALQLNPEEPEFGIWKAWCEFLRAEDKKRQQAPSAAAIEAGLKKNPRCAPGYLFLGQMAKVLGDLALAERHLRRGLAAAPDSADLARELKYLRK